MTHFKRMLALGFACTAMIMNTGAHAQDDAAQSPHFYPAKAWEVGSIKAVTDYSGECIIQTEFNNGFLLQINGSSNWVQQMNLNIRQSAFEAGNSYDVAVSVPGQVNEVITGTANRGNIVSVPMKGKKELYKAMRDNGVLDIGIEGNEFRFFLTGFNQAANKFERCMAGGAPGVVAATHGRDEQVGGLGGIVADEEISVSSDDMSDAEKDFLVNESIAFEEQEVAATDVDVAVPTEKKDDVTAAQVTEEDAVAALNASAVDAIRAQDNPANTAVSPNEVAAASASSDSSEATDTFSDLEPLDGGALEEADMSDEPFTPAPQEMQVTRDNEPDPIVVVMDPPAENSEADVMAATEPMAAPAVEVEAVAVEDVPIMPRSDVEAAESYLSQPEKSIDMPDVKVNKTASRGQADFSTANIETADSTALARIVALEKALEEERAKNDALQDELEVTLEESKQEVMTVQSENWNLERATMRYNEAERQMKKLGQQLQKERAQWAMEKKELETMLFDPEVTSQEQLARLSKLEQELAATKAELEAARAGMATQ